MFDRVTGGPMFYVIRSTDDSLMIHCCSFTCETDGHLGISNGRLTDWAYCTQAPPASSDVKEAKRLYPDRSAD